MGNNLLFPYSVARLCILSSNALCVCSNALSFGETAIFAIVCFAVSFTYSTASKAKNVFSHSTCLSRQYVTHYFALAALPHSKGFLLHKAGELPDPTFCLFCCCHIVLEPRAHQRAGGPDRDASSIVEPACM